MKQQFKMKQLLMVLLMVSAILGTSAVIPYGMSSNSFAYAMVVGVNYDITYAALDATNEVNEAMIIIENADIEGFDDDQIYRLLSLTYSKAGWAEATNEVLVYNLRSLIVGRAGWFNNFYQNPIMGVIQYELNVEWPPNNGFDGAINPTMLGVGIQIDRYGYPGGRFLSPIGLGYEERALAPGTKEVKPYFQYEVLIEFEVDEGLIAPWFGVVGGGNQYYLSGGMTVQDLIDGGFLELIE